MVDHGIKPCYIFDGKPPELKGGVVSYQSRSCTSLPAASEPGSVAPRSLSSSGQQLAKRFAKRNEAKEGEEEAKETGEMRLRVKLS